MSLPDCVARTVLRDFVARIVLPDCAPRNVRSSRIVSSSTNLKMMH